MQTWPTVNRQAIAAGQVAAGASVTVQVPDPGQWQIVAVTFRVVTSAVVATRTPVVTINGGDAVAVALAAAGYGITASSTADYSYCLGLSEWDQSNNAAASGPAPTLPLDPGDSIVISLGAGDVGDQISRVRVVLGAIAVDAVAP